MEKKEKINLILQDIEKLQFDYINCIRLIALVHKLKTDLSFYDGKELFKDGIRQTIQKELSDLINFTNSQDLERYFNNVKSEIEIDKHQYWDIETFDK